MPALGELESTIMERMWSNRRPTSVRDMLAVLREEREIAYTTVMTVMDKLHTKGLLTRKLVNRAYLYQTLSSREAYIADQMRATLAGGGNRAATFVHFLEGLSQEEAEALAAALRVIPPGERPA